MPVVSLPMYDLPGTRPALNAFWGGLRRHLRREGIDDLPARLTLGRSVHALWSDPCLLISQCCGMDLMGRFEDRLKPLATPRYGAPGCLGSQYASVVVAGDHVRAEDVLHMRGAVCVINGPGSHSGMNALRQLVAPESQRGRFFRRVEVSGSHLASLALLRRGVADVAAIDCVTYAMLEYYNPAALAGTRRLGLTYRAAGVPYVTRRAVDADTVERLRAGILNTFADPILTEPRRALYLKDIDVLPADAYRPIADVAAMAEAFGFRQMG